MTAKAGTKTHRLRDLAVAGSCGALALVAAAGCRPDVHVVEPAPSEIEVTLFLIGDAGAPDPREVGAPLDSLAMHATATTAPTAIVFLGDNVYPTGVPEEGRAEWADARRRLAAQIRSIPRDARGFFLPGNADWDKEEPFGLYSIRLQERMIADLANGRDVRMLPGNGCPGPVTVDMGRLRLIALDTQWWLHDYIVADEESDCTTDVGVITEALRADVQPEREDRVVVVAAHHPLMTGGAHGGYCGVTGPFRRFGRRSQDIISSSNRTMRDSIESALSARPPLVFAAGHDHNLQVLRGGRNVDYVLVSGAGSYSKAACSVHMRESYYASQYHSGFMRLDILRGSGVLLRVYHYDGKGEGGLSYSRWLEPQRS